MCAYYEVIMRGIMFILTCLIYVVEIEALDTWSTPDTISDGSNKVLPKFTIDSHSMDRSENDETIRAY